MRFSVSNKNQKFSYVYNYGRIIVSLFFKIKRKIGVLLTHEFSSYASLCGNLEFQTAKTHILLSVLCLK